MKSLILAAAALAAIPSASEAQTRGTLTVQIGESPYPRSYYEPRHGYYNPRDYLYCRRPNGKTGIVTDQYGRPVTNYSYNYYNRSNLRYLKCSKIRGYYR